MNNEFNFESNPYAPQEKKNKNGYAVASLVLGIVALLSCCCRSSGLGLFVMGVSAVLAIVFAFLSKKNTNGKIDAKAIAGLVLGIVVIVVLICFAAAVVGIYAMIDTVPQDELLTMLENTYKPMVDEKTYNDIVESIKAIYAAREN